MKTKPFGHSFSAWVSLLIVAFIAVPMVSGQPPATTAETKPDAVKEKKKNDAKWEPLTGSWQACQFGGDGPVEITDKLIKMSYGDPLTGIRWEKDKDVVRENYEIELEARRTDGFDFFCGLTFPVGEAQVSLILGGWGGGIVGISSIDGRDASDNQTTQFRNFDNEKWYRVRARVQPDRIICWIDDKIIVNHEREGHEFDIRYEMDPCTPLGIAAFQCESEIRNIRWRRLTEQEIAGDDESLRKDSKTPANESKAPEK